MRKEIIIDRDYKGIAQVRIYGGRASFAFLNEADKNGLFRTDIIVEKTMKGASELKQAILEIGKTKFGTGWKCPILKDGDKLVQDFVDQGGDAEDRKHYVGCYILTGNSKKQPDIRGNIYSGSFIAAVLKPAIYDLPASPTSPRSYGVKGYINAAVFMEDGERLGGSSSISADILGIEPVKETNSIESLAKSIGGTVESYEDDIPF